MRQHEHAVPPGASVRPTLEHILYPLEAIGAFVLKALTIAEFEARKLRHDPTDLAMRAVQPLLWLVIFGQVFSRLRAIPTGNISYLDFLAPGILAQSVFFVAIFSGMAIIWERDLGIAHKFLVTPTPRAALVLGKALAAGVRSLAQAVIVYAIATVMGVQMNWNPFALIAVLVVVVLGASCFSTFSLLIACLVKSRERFMGIGQVLTMPLFFASNAIYPIEVMPGWLQAVARANPLTYLVDALRALMIAGGTSSSGIDVDIGVLLLATTILVIICGRLYPRVVI